MIQYASRFIKFQATGSNDTVAKSFDGLFCKWSIKEQTHLSKWLIWTSLQFVENMSVARKLFRLFKFFNEYVKILAIKGGKLPEMEKTL